MADEILEVLDGLDGLDGEEPIEPTLLPPDWVAIDDPITRGVPFWISWSEVYGYAPLYTVIAVYPGQQFQQVIRTTNETSATWTVPLSNTYPEIFVKVFAKQGGNVSPATNSPTRVIQPPPNRPPTIPPTITVPTTIRLGVPYTVSWGASTDPEGEAVTYELSDRKNGGSWSILTTTTGLSISTSLALNSGVTSVTYRVRARDPQNNWSGYMVSPTRNVTANSAPPAPPTITVPTTIYFNTPFTVSWGASTDPDGDAVTYYLEYQRTGYTWTPVISGTTSRTRTATIPHRDGFQYRVRAKDSLGAFSPWTTSATRTVTNRLPTMPPSITVPTTIQLGVSHTVSWGASTDPDGDAITYALSRQTNNGAWGVVTTTTGLSLSTSLALNSGATSVAYRVRAGDPYNGHSHHTVSPTRPVSGDKPPVISGTDRHIGTLGSPFSYDYTVTDPEGEAVSIIEYINGTAQRTFGAPSGEEHTFVISAKTFGLLPNGDNVFSITASDIKGGTATRTLAFTKKPDRISVTYDDAKPAYEKPIRINILPRGNFPAGARYKAYVTNNGFDKAPVWEDCTQSVNSRVAHVFKNSSKRGTSWGVNFKLEIFRDCAIASDLCTLNGVSIQWE